jgi:hypothetical protein
MRRALLLLTAAMTVVALNGDAGAAGAVPHEVLTEIANTAGPQAVAAVQRRHRLRRLEARNFRLTGTTLYRWRIPDHRSVAHVVRELRSDKAVASAQPNFVFATQQRHLHSKNANVSATAEH